MQLRWATYYNKVLAVEVERYAKEENVSMMEAHKILVDKTEPILEYYNGKQWLPVEEVVIAR